MLKLLITGASSFIGNAVQEHLKDSADITVTAVSVRGSDWRSMDFSGFDSILHAAGIAHISPDPSISEQYDAVNHRLTVELARKAKAEGVKQFIFLSSMIVFGEASPAGVRKTITPESKPAPVNAYGQSKLDAENALRALEDESFRVAILRPPMVYGPGCKGNYNALVKLARKLPVFPRFDNHRSMIYVENLAELIRLIVLRGDRGTFHPQDAADQSVTAIVQQICAAHQKRMRFTSIFNPLVRLAGRGGIVRRAFGDMVYAQSMSEYPENYRIIGFEEAVRRTEGGASWRV